MPEVAHLQSLGRLPALGSQAFTRDTSSCKACVSLLLSAELRGS